MKRHRTPAPLPSIGKTRISDSEVRKVQFKNDLNDLPPHRILGGGMFPALCGSVFVCAPTNSGKTNFLLNVVAECADRNKTRLIFIVGTKDADTAYIEFQKTMHKADIEVEFYDDLYCLPGIIRELKHSKVVKKNVSMATLMRRRLLNRPELQDDSDDDEDDDEDKRGLIAPSVMVLIDDMGQDLRRSSAVVELLKQCRHYGERGCKVVISSQYAVDLTPGSILQLWYLILLKGINKEKLKHIYEKTGIGIDYEVFEALYDNATEEKFDFLYCDLKKGEFRHNFKELYLISPKKPDEIPMQ
jgi:hypothetical protein